MAITLPSALFLLLVAATVSTAVVVAKERCHPEDKKVLLGIQKFYNNAYLLSSWSASTDCCTDWCLVQCDETTNRIKSLVIKDDNLPGVIDPAVSDLPYLQFLSFSNVPNITGPIPSTIAKLKYLKYLWIDHTSVTGSIPDFLHTLKDLFYVNLSFNKLTGSIPPSLPLAPSLNYLRLDFNQLTGTIPATLGSAQLYGLYLSHNQLTGPIPTSLGNVNYTLLYLDNNRLTGDASFLFGKTKQLNEMDLSRNLLSFDISKVELPLIIGWLLLDHNQIYGSLPPSLAQLQDMNNFNVSYNRLCGKIPTGGKRMAGFDKYSYIHNKCLCGSPLPACK